MCIHKTNSETVCLIPLLIEQCATDVYLHPVVFLSFLAFQLFVPADVYKRKCVHIILGCNY